MTTRRPLFPASRFLGLLCLTLLLGGCQNMLYEVNEALGIPKRDILVSRVTRARDAQQEAKEQFASALEQFRSVVQFEGGSLEDKYNKLSAELDRSESRAQAVYDRIDAVEHVAEALFAEWEDELDQYHNAELRRSSARQLQATRQRYDQMIAAMHQAERRIEPVLVPLRDQVLYLKHNLNAKAVAALDEELLTIETEVDRLIAEMEASITEANQFIQEMEQQTP